MAGTPLALVLCVLAAPILVFSLKRSHGFGYEGQGQYQHAARQPQDQQLQFFSIPLRQPKYPSSAFALSPKQLAQQGANQIPPPNECAPYFRYVQGPDGRTAGQIQINYSGPQVDVHVLQVNMSVTDHLYPGEVLNISFTSSGGERDYHKRSIIEGRLYKFEVKFPRTTYEFIPWIVYINFDGGALCTAQGPPPSPHLPTVLMWSYLRISSDGGGGTSEVPPPTTERPPGCPPCPITCPTPTPPPCTTTPPPCGTTWPPWPRSIRDSGNSTGFVKGYDAVSLSGRKK